jgi:site-specific recombinase
MQQNKEAIKEVRQERKEDRQEIKELNEKVDRLTEIVQRLAFELQRQSDKANTERRILLLEVENMLLRHRRDLPPPDKPGDES